MMKRLLKGIQDGIHPENKLLDRGYNIMSVEDAVAKIAERGIFRDLDSVRTVADLEIERGWQLQGVTLIGFLATILNEQYEGVDVVAVNDKLLWTHGRKIVPK